MIDLYSWTTPNGRKVSIALEELGLPYEVHPVNIGQGDQFKPDFLKISPNNRIPAIVDRDTGITMMESGAILLYLAEKTGKLMPTDTETRWQVIEWLMWQMGGLGPMLGQAHYFMHYNPGLSPPSEERYGKETQRLYKVLNTRLEGRDFIAGDYSIADIAAWPWVGRHERHGVNPEAFPNVRRWYNSIAERPAVKAGFDVPKTTEPIPVM